MDILQIPSTIETYSRRMDGTLKLVISCQELAPEDMATLAGLAGKFGNFVFKESTIQPEDIPNDKTIEFKDVKTLSERLRNTLYVLHVKRGGKAEEFDKARKDYMEKLILGLKNQIAKYE